MPTELDKGAAYGAGVEIPDDLMTLQDTIRKLSFLPRDAVRRAVTNGAVKHWQFGARATIWVSESEVNDWVAEVTVPRRGRRGEPAAEAGTI